MFAHECPKSAEASWAKIVLKGVEDHIARVSKFIVERDNEADPGLQVELDRLLLRITCNPTLLSYLAGIGTKDGKVELDFYEMPDEGTRAVQSIIGVPDIEVFRYTVRGAPHVGFRFDLKPLVQRVTGAESKR